MLTNSHIFCLPFNKSKLGTDKTVGWYKYKCKTFLLYVRITAVCYNHLHDSECRINNDFSVDNFLNPIFLYECIIGLWFIICCCNCKQRLRKDCTWTSWTPPQSRWPVTLSKAFLRWQRLLWDIPENEEMSGFRIGILSNSVCTSVVVGITCFFFFLNNPWVC